MNLEIHNLTKLYQGRTVLRNFSLTLEEGKIYCLMAPSGCGKTTLFRLILGLEQPDSGSIEGVEGRRFGVVFQEDRLCEAYSPLENVMMTADRMVTRSMAVRELSRLLPEESVTRPVFTLSGGMKRRTAVCRALLAPCDIVLMDEPFAGLDEETRQEVIAWILEKAAGKTVLISTHQEEDVEALGARLIRLRDTGETGQS